MNNPANKARTWVTALVLLVGIALVWTVMLTNRGKADQGIDELRRECAALRAQIEACSTSTAELQAAMQQLRGARSDLPARRTLPAFETESSDLALVRALTELSLVQSNTAIVVERLLKSTPDVKPAETSEQVSKRRQAFEASAAQEQQRYEEMKHKVTGLLLSLKVPDEVATIPTSKALEMTSLQAYWPYFEAKKELEPLDRVMESLKHRMAQERIQAGMDADGGRAQ